ncbi:hypothetical protein I4U23_031271 [Adineta vaga]|nr:hypothetical protein I4U23_031271 [Adineta vaga]
MSKDKSFDENDFSSIVARSFRHIIEKSVTDLVLPYKILALSHHSSWNTFENDFIQILKQNSIDHEEFLLLHNFNFHKNYFNENDIYCQSLFKFNIDLIPTQSDFDRLCQLL